MKKFMCSQVVNDLNESIIEELLTVESLVQATMNSCLSRECGAQYYNSSELTSKLSEERNHYLNLLTIALEKVAILKGINKNLEEEIYSL